MPSLLPDMSQGRNPGGTCGLIAGRGHAGALASGEGVQGPRFPREGAAAEPASAASSGHAACCSETKIFLSIFYLLGSLKLMVTQGNSVLTIDMEFCT